MTNPYSTPFTPEMVAAIHATDPRDLVNFEPSRARNLAILNFIYGTNFSDDAGKGTYRETR